jgi:hypothetical protein
MSTKTEVWFGNMTHGIFYVAGKDDEEPCVIVHSIDEKRMMDLDKEDVDDFICGGGYDSYLIPSRFGGVVVFSKKEVAL